jgi:NADH-quinone oxidoreductase subunit E
MILVMETSPQNGSKELDILPLDKLISKYVGIKGAIIPLLQETQKIYGYLPIEALKRIADKTNTEVSQIYGVATFYTQFRLEPVGKHIIRVCHGTACHVSGAERVTEVCEEELSIKDGETTDDLEFTLDSVACLGCCSLAPVMMIDEQTHGRLTDREIRKIIRKLRI